jgi:molybdopterin-binding protein
MRATTGSVMVGVMRLSTRNQLRGTVVDVHLGEALSTVKVELGGGDVITSAITREAAVDLGLTSGTPVTVLVKATDVSLAVDD